MESPMAAMIDVVFLLLIYFIVAQKPIIDGTLLDINIPDHGKSRSLVQNPLIVEVREFISGQPEKDADLYGVAGTVLKLDQLRVLFKQNFTGEDKGSLLISCSPEARHRKLVSLLDLCAETGVERISVVNQ
ncbi:MAG: hypothetical protein A2X49_02380 [Lentisphaerae bacterium GWF2_52_8]|nr:MAG: hypothetical protein A2X49_02380 [Lentisphaerae bacterium GWF2_52_8]